MKFLLERYPSNATAHPILEARKEIAWEGGAVFNPSVISHGDVLVMAYRAYTSKLTENAPKVNRPGNFLLHQTSYIGYAESTDGITFTRRDTPLISPSEPYDMHGCEDPRITKIDDVYYITYTAIDAPLDDETADPNVRIALASTKDFQTIEKHGIIGPSVCSKASAFFPERIGGKIALALTISSDSVESHIVIRYFDSMDDVLQRDEKGWETFLENTENNILLPWHAWLKRGPELGATPVLTEKGWLFIYSGEAMSHTWCIAAALFDKEDPTKLIGRSHGCILEPIFDYERDGLVPNVTFPEGAVVIGEKLLVYYGCADTRIGLATCDINELLSYLEKCK